MLSSVLIGCATLFLIAVLWVLEMKRRYNAVAHIPGPKRSFFLGNIMDLGDNPVELLKHLSAFFKIYGKNVLIWIGPTRPNIWTTDLKLVEFLLTSTKHIDKSQDYRYVHDWLGDGILLGAGDKWRNHRKIINPTFHVKILANFVEVFNRCGDILIEKLSKEVDKDSVDIFPYIVPCALDIICETAMGISINAQKNSDHEYMHAVKNMCNILIERTYSTWKQFDILFMLSKSYNLSKESLSILHGQTQSVINSKRIAMENEKRKKEQGEKETNETDDLGVRKRMAFLDLLMNSDHKGEALNNTELMNEVNTMLFAGHDTTTSAICFTLYEIARHPEVQDKLVEELRSVFADDKSRQITFTDMNNMPYMDCVIKEGLRLYPSVPLIGRELKEDANYEGLILPKGLTIIMAPFFLHRDPDLYPDPEKFDPDRFLPENMKGRNTFAYIPFSAGLRNCVGQKFAQLEMKVTISKILCNFELSEVPGHDLVLSTEVVLKSVSGVCMKLTKREF